MNAKKPMKRPPAWRRSPKIPTIRALCLAAGLLLPAAAWAQKPMLSLAQAVALARRNYPQVRESRQTAGAERERARLARLSFLPQLQLYGQATRATANNLAGPLFFNPFPAVSGPVSLASGVGVWGQISGAEIAWEPYAFGRRRAGVASARWAARGARERLQLTRLEAGTAAAAAFLSVLAASKQVSVARANVRRWRIVDRMVHGLVAAQLRPGSDASRADAELAAAQMVAVRAQRVLARARARLAVWLARPGASWRLQTGGLISTLPPHPAWLRHLRLRRHPAMRTQADAVCSAMAHQRQVARSALPRFYALGAADARTGPGVATAPLLRGQYATAGNWAVGGSVQFSITRWLRVQRRDAIARRQTRRQQDISRRIHQRLTYAARKARAGWRAALTLAGIAPRELDAAKTGEVQARARYQAGLSSIVNLAAAEDILSQAQGTAALAAIHAWAALLRRTYLYGHLRPFLHAVQTSYPQRKP